jgi:hypothetical protein
MPKQPDRRGHHMTSAGGPARRPEAGAGAAHVRAGDVGVAGGTPGRRVDELAVPAAQVGSPRRPRNGDGGRGHVAGLGAGGSARRDCQAERILGKKTLENEILRDAVELSVEKVDRPLALAAQGDAVKTVCDTLGVARSNLNQRRCSPADCVDGRSDRTASSIPVCWRTSPPRLPASKLRLAACGRWSIEPGVRTVAGR